MTSLLAVHSALLLPPWLQAPGWVIGLSEGIRHFIHQHQQVGLFGLVFAEELGVPLPVPGDIAVLWAGYQTRFGHLTMGGAFVVVVLAATLGSSGLFTVSRYLGHGFLVRYGSRIGLDGRRLARAERAFSRYGAWAIVVGRLIPGFRIVMSAFAGSFAVPYLVFVPSAMASAMIWATVLLELGRRLGPETIALFAVVPAHLLPVLLLALMVALGVLLTVHWRSLPAAPPAAKARV